MRFSETRRLGEWAWGSPVVEVKQMSGFLAHNIEMGRQMGKDRHYDPSSSLLKGRNHQHMMKINSTITEGKMRENELRKR